MKIFTMVKQIVKHIAILPTAVSALIPRNHMGVKYNLSVATIDQYAEPYKFDKTLHGQIVLSLTTLGGAFATETHQEAIDEMSLKMTNAGKNVEAFLMEQMSTTGYKIVFVKDFLQGLNKEELKAVLYHELGHLTAGHLRCGKVGILDDLSFELEADEYGAKYTSNSIMSSALNKILANITKYVSVNSPSELPAVNERLYGKDSAMTKRFEALQS